MADQANLAAVRRMAEHGTPEQRRRARFWLKAKGHQVKT